MAHWTEILPSGRPFWTALLARLRKAGALARQRRRLAELDDAMLHDIGLTRDQALHEARRPRWDAPDHWRF